MGIICIVIAIIFGAFGAHALKEKISAEKLLSFETGVRYLMYHGLAFLILGFQDKFPIGKTIILFLILGITLFSGSIFLLSLSDYWQINFKFLGPITPLGGLSLIVGWVIFAFKIVKNKSL